MIFQDGLMNDNECIKHGFVSVAVYMETELPKCCRTA